MDVNGLDKGALNQYEEQEEGEDDCCNTGFRSVVDTDESDIDQFFVNGLITQVSIHNIVFVVVLVIAETTNDQSRRHEELNQGQSPHLQTVQCARVVG